MSFTLPALPYAYDALEPHFDKQTMEIHHTKHHQAYVNNANAALESLPEFADLSVEELITKLDQLPADKKVPLRNNAGSFSGYCAPICSTPWRAFSWRIIEMSPISSPCPLR